MMDDNELNLITYDMLPKDLLQIEQHEDSSNNIDLEYLYSLKLKEARNIFEHDYIEKNLDRFNGNVSKTANFIGMERSAFHRKLNILKKLETKLKEIYMNVIICGAGEVGYNIARLLSDEKNQITIIDHDEDRIEQISNKLDVRTLIGYASHPKILKEAEADKSDMIIAVTQSDEINMISCQIASALFSVPIKIARVRSEAYNMEEWKHLFNEGLFSIDALISPEQEVAKSFTRLVAVPGAKDLISFDDDLVRLIEINLAEDCPVLNTS